MIKDFSELETDFNSETKEEDFSAALRKTKQRSKRWHRDVPAKWETHPRDNDRDRMHNNAWSRVVERGKRILQGRDHTYDRQRSEFLADQGYEDQDAA